MVDSEFPEMALKYWYIDFNFTLYQEAQIHVWMVTQLIMPWSALAHRQF
jgi:hypothetical protein